MAVGTVTGRTVTSTITAATGAVYIKQNIAAATTTKQIVAVTRQKGTAAECDLIAIKLPTAVGASGDTTDAILTWRLAGPGTAVTYPVVLSVTEVDTA